MSIPQRADYHGLAGHAAAFLARLVGWNGTALVQADVSGLAYKVFDLDAEGQQTGTGTLVVANTVFDALQLDAAWTAAGGDGTGYNVKAVLPGSCFPNPNHHYQVELHATPASGEAFVVVWRYFAEAVYG